MTVYTYTISRANDTSRAKLLLNTLTEARNTANYPFYWDLHCCGASYAEDVGNSALKMGLIDELTVHKDNVGQHVCTNEAISKAADYKYLLRLDDDIQFKTKRWLSKLVRASCALDDKMIISPVIRGLKNPPATSNVCTSNGVKLVFLLDAIGGICRLHPMSLLTITGKEYVSDVRLPLGSGDATGIAAWAKNNLVPIAYIKHINLRHAMGTLGQESDDPAYFKEHAIFQSIPYIPAWIGEDNG